MFVTILRKHHIMNVSVRNSEKPSGFLLVLILLKTAAIKNAI